MGIGQALVWQAFIFFVIALGFGVAAGILNDSRPRGGNRVVYVLLSASLLFATLTFMSFTLAIWAEYAQVG